MDTPTTEPTPAPLKAWQVCDEDIVAARTYAEAVAWWVAQDPTHFKAEDANDPADDNEVAGTVFVRYADGPVDGVDGETVAEILAGATEPFLVASTEY